MYFNKKAWQMIWSHPPATNPLRQAFWSNFWILCSIVIFSFFAALLQMTVPLFMLLIYDRVVPSRSFETLVSLAGLALVLLSIMGVLDFARRRLLARFGARLQAEVEDHAAVVSSPATPKLTSKEVQLIDGIRGFFNSASVVSMIDILWVPIFLAAVFILHPWFGYTALGGVVTLVAIFAAGSALSSFRKAASDAAQEKLGDMVNRLKRGKDVVASQRLSRPIQVHWKEARSQARLAAIRSKDYVAGTATLLRTARAIFSVVILFVGATLVLQSQISTGALIAGVILLNRIFMPVSNLFIELPAIRTARQKWASLSSAFETAAKVPAQMQLAVPQGVGIAAKGVTLTEDFGGTPVIKDSSFAIELGRMVEITGDSGSGKSLLAAMLMGLKRPKTGSVQIGNTDLRNIAPEELAGLFGYLPQTQRFLGGSIADNIASFAPQIDMDQVLEAARNAQMHDAIQALPRGYRTEIDEIGSRLSDGQRQLLGLARALYGQPRFLVLDEPGSILDEAFGKNLKGAIESYLVEGRSILILGRQPYRLPLSVERYRIEESRIVQSADPYMGDMTIIPKLVRPAS